MNGNNIIIKLNGTAIAATKSNEWETQCETIEVSSPTQGAWRDYIAGRKEWSVTTGFLVLAEADIQKCLNIGTTYTLTFCDNNGSGTARLRGTAILQTCKITATRGNICNGSFKFTGCGALAIPASQGGGGLE